MYFEKALKKIFEYPSSIKEDSSKKEVSFCLIKQITIENSLIAKTKRIFGENCKIQIKGDVDTRYADQGDIDGCLKITIKEVSTFPSLDLTGL